MYTDLVCYDLMPLWYTDMLNWVYPCRDCVAWYVSAVSWFNGPRSIMSLFIFCILCGCYIHVNSWCPAVAWVILRQFHSLSDSRESLQFHASDTSVSWYYTVVLSRSYRGTWNDCLISMLDPSFMVQTGGYEVGELPGTGPVLWVWCVALAELRDWTLFAQLAPSLCSFPE